jgi:Fe-S-cluster containining protein
MGYPAFREPYESSPDARYWLAMPSELRDELRQYIAAYQKPADGELDGPCCWFDMETRRCRHHEYRPAVCRDFRIGSRGCHQWRRHYRELIQLRVSRSGK